jgi:hypothetical protein
MAGVAGRGILTNQCARGPGSRRMRP